MGLNLAMSLEQLLFSVLSALFAIAVHEYAHGVVAYKLGDPTPKVLGRLTLNPLKHLDPIGLLMLVLFRVGWAKPVEINSLRFKNRRRGVVLVALAGPLANVTVAWVLNLLSFFVLRLPISGQLWFSLYTLFVVSIQINIWFAAFNLIPIPPLDGSKVVSNLLPLKARLQYERITPYAPLILILGVWSGLLSRVISPIARFLLWIVQRISF